MNNAPLKGIKVVELARVLAGPWIGQTLADLGAEVIKIESPKGDETRHWGPPFFKRDDDETAAYFHSTNRGKVGYVADFNDPNDLAYVKELIAEADIVVENFKVGGLEKYGLDYTTLSKKHPQLIYASITGFGQDGPRAHQPGYDFLIQGMSGIMDLTGEPDGRPQKVGVAWIDIFTGLYGVIGIQAALWERAQSGRGQHVDLSLLDCGVGVLANQATNYLLGGVNPTRRGNAHPNIVPYQEFEARDGYVIIACGNDGQFMALCEALDIDNDPRFASNAKRVEHRVELKDLIETKTRMIDADELIGIFEQAGVPCGPINTVEAALNDPQILARGMKIAPEGVAGLRTPIKFSRSELNLEKAAPKFARVDRKSDD